MLYSFMQSSFSHAFIICGCWSRFAVASPLGKAHFFAPFFKWRSWQIYDFAKIF